MKNSSLNELDLAAKAASTSIPARDPLALHFRSMASYRLLTREDEHALARQLEKADLSLVRALLGAPEGRAALLEVAAGLRDKELRVEDVERNPADGLIERIESVVERAASFSERPRARARPSAQGLRLHPRVVRRLVGDLVVLAARQPRNARLRRTLRDVDEARREGERVTAELVQSNLRIVVTFARRYRGMPLVNLIQEGNLGLLRAVDKFDHRRGLRFSTYAAWSIRHALGRALANQSKVIRLPVHLTGALQRVRRAQDRLQRETARSATAEELATRTGLPIEQVRRALDVVSQPISLEAPASGEGREGAVLGELVVDHAARPADDVVAQNELQASTTALLSALPDRRGRGHPSALRAQRRRAAHAGGPRRAPVALARTSPPARTRRAEEAARRRREAATARAPREVRGRAHERPLPGAAG